MEVDPVLGRAEPDPEIQELIAASAGLNFGIDFLPGSLTFDPAADAGPDPMLAASVVWLDALTMNVDRTPRNPNLLVWHGRLWLIDHGAALYVHHGRGCRPRVPGARSRRSAITCCCRTRRRSRRRTRELARGSTRDVIEAVVGASRRVASGDARSRRRTSASCERAARGARAGSPRRPSVPGSADARSSTRVLRVVPRVERGEAINAGVVLFARRRGFLAARVELDADRLAALAPDADADAIARQLDARARIAAGDPGGRADRAARPSPSGSTGSSAPSSTVIQPSPVHTGLCDDPEATLDRLFVRLVQ